VGLLQHPLGVFHGQKLQKPLGGHSSPTPEQPLQMKGTQIQPSRDILQTRLPIDMLIDKTDSRRDAFIVVFHDDLVDMTSMTARLLSVGGGHHPILATKKGDA
jgi:hypothetical protein